MTISRLRRRHFRSYERADVRGWQLALLIGLRAYALIAIAIAGYAFVHALR